MSHFVHPYGHQVLQCCTQVPKAACCVSRKAEQFSDALFEAEFLQALQHLLLMLEPPPP